MKIKKLWAIYVQRNPSFEGESDTLITLTVRGFRKFFDETYSHAHTQGGNEGLAACKEHMEKLRAEKEELERRVAALTAPKTTTEKTLAEIFGKNDW